MVSSIGVNIHHAMRFVTISLVTLTCETDFLFGYHRDSMFKMILQ